MEFKKEYEALKKTYEEKSAYRQKVVAELEKTNEELLRIEGGINVLVAFIKEEESSKKEEVKEPTKKK